MQITYEAQSQVLSNAKLSGRGRKPDGFTWAKKKTRR